MWTRLILLIGFLFLTSSVNAVECNEVKGMRQLEAFGRRIAKKNQLKYLNKGMGTIVNSKNVSWDISLMGFQKLNIDEARVLIVNIIDEFLYMVTKDPLFDTSLKNEHKLHWYDTIFSPKRIGVKLTFWDENIDRYPLPYISQIKASEGQIFYYHSNPDKSLTLIHQETFEKAFALIE